MKSLFILFSFAIGVLMSVHALMNARVGMIGRNIFMANASFWLIGALTACTIAFFRWDNQYFHNIAGMSKWLLLAGSFGACIAISMNFLIPKLGLTNTTILMVFAQIIAAALLSHYGIMGQEVRPINLQRIIGIILALAGTYLVIR